VESFLTAGERLSLTEQEALPGPYMELLDHAKGMLGQYRAEAAERARKNK